MKLTIPKTRKALDPSGENSVWIRGMYHYATLPSARGFLSKEYKNPTLYVSRQRVVELIEQHVAAAIKERDERIVKLLDMIPKPKRIIVKGKAE